jgi:RNA polymerase sigma-70 factor (ECF subfamily)
LPHPDRKGGLNPLGNVSQRQISGAVAGGAAGAEAALLMRVAASRLSRQLRPSLRNSVHLDDVCHLLARLPAAMSRAMLGSDRPSQRDRMRSTAVGDVAAVGDEAAGDRRAGRPSRAVLHLRQAPDARPAELAGIEWAPQDIGMSSDFSLFERHVDALYRSALRLTRKPEDAEDLVQETYLRAYRYRNRFTPGTNEKAWLFTIMTNVFRNRLRQHPAAENSIDQPGTDFSIYEQLKREGTPVHLMSPEEIIVDRGFGVEVKRALEELPVNMRMVVILVDVEDFSYKEVASILNIKIGTVMSRLHRGRQALQKKLWEYSGRPRSRQMAVGAH